jgi:hypothetical protein
LRPDQIAGGFQPEALPHWDDAFLAMARPRREFSTAAHLEDRALHGYVTPARVRQSAAVACAERAAGAGLVSVPTTGNVPLATKGLPGELSTANSRWSAENLRSSLGAFQLDQAVRRLSSLRCAVGVAARAHAVSEKGRRSDRAWMVTLTYRPGVAWLPGHVKEALRAMRNWCKRAGFAFRYVWIAEIQDGKRRADGIGRQVIHYHVAVWLPASVKCPHFDARGWWPHGMSQSKLATHATGYLMHYLKKDKDLAAMPKGARAYGVGGLDCSLCRARRWLRLPSFVQGNSSIWDDWRRRVGGGWVSPDGECFASEFASVVVAGVRCLVRVVRHATSIEASGPFSWLTDRARVLALVA